MSERPLVHQHRFTPHDDHSATFGAIRSELRNADVTPPSQRLKALRPDYRQVRFDLALGYLGLVWTCASTIWFARMGTAGALVGFVCGAAGIGFWIGYLQLFIHEGAHANLAASRKTSDRICDACVGWMIGTSVRKYRKVHFGHHRVFGTTGDTENTCFRPLNAAFILKALAGWRVVQVLAARARVSAPRVAGQSAAPSSQGAAPRAEGALRDRAVLLGGITAQLAIASLLHALGGWAVPLAWIVGVDMGPAMDARRTAYGAALSALYNRR